MLKPRRSRVSHRLLAICVAFTLPVTALLFVAVQARTDQIRFTDAERRGVAYLQPLQTLVSALPAYEQNSNVALGRTIEASIVELEQRAANENKPGIPRAVQRVRQIWKVSEGAPTDKSSADIDSPLVLAVNEVIRVVGDSTHLVVDPDLDSYYTMDTALGKMPLLFTLSSNLNRFGAQVLASNDFTAEARTRLTALTTMLEETSRALDRNLRVAFVNNPSRTLRPALEQLLIQSSSVVMAQVDVGEKLGRNAVVKPSVAEYLAAGDAVSASISTLWREAASVLDALLQQRIDHLKGSRLQSIGLVALAFAVIVLLVIATMRDLRRRQAAERELEVQATHDALTGLPNRKLFRSKVEEALAQTRETGRPIAVLFIDLDDFKSVNDTLGHGAGDELLCTVAARMTSCVRSSDTASRLSGDEFAVLLDDPRDTAGATEFAERLLASFANPVTLAGRSVHVKASIGIMLSLPGVETAEDMLRNADLAMYKAKKAGKGAYACFDSGLVESAVDRFDLATDLRRAVEQGEFVLRYQPIVQLEDGQITGVEALVRWEHPERGTVSPAAFIPFAEESGLIVPLGLWVLREACRQARRWQMSDPRRAEFGISVNVAARQLAEPDFVGAVAQILAETGVAPRTLVLEITESAAVANDPGAIRRLRELRTLGLRLAVDDFGTGYASLSYLKMFEVDILKVDRSFIAELGRSVAGEALARGIVELGHSLGLQTVAEGIEFDDQLGALRDTACDVGQGFLFAPALAPEQVEELLNDPDGFRTYFPTAMPLAMASIPGHRDPADGQLHPKTRKETA